MDERINLSYTRDEKALWKKFKKAFTDTYMDIAEGVKVDKELQELHMKDGNINTYSASKNWSSVLYFLIV